MWNRRTKLKNEKINRKDKKKDGKGGINFGKVFSNKEKDKPHS
jgi:hypothetical protein